MEGCKERVECRGEARGGNSSSRQLLSDISLVAERRMTCTVPPIMDACNRCLYGDLRWLVSV